MLRLILKEDTVRVSVGGAVGFAGAYAMTRFLLYRFFAGRNLRRRRPACVGYRGALRLLSTNSAHG